MQSRTRSAVEVLTGTVTGFVGSWLIMLACLHVWGNDTMTVATITTFACTVWSIVRNYTLRRLFARLEK